MSSVLDHTAGMGVETTFGTAVVETRWFEILPSSTVEFDPEQKQGQGLRTSSIVPRSGRRRAGLGSGTLVLKVELYTKGFGLLWSACLPSVVSTVVSGTTYQQLASLVQTGIGLGSRTIQVGVIDATGVSRPHRFSGCTVSKWTLDIPAPDSDAAATLEVTFDLRRTPDTVTVLTVPVMPSAPTIYLPRDVSSVTYGGAVVAPTTTALATGGTSVGYCRSVKIECDNNLSQRPNYSAYGQPAAGLRQPTITLDAEFADTVLRDAYLGQTDNAFTLTLTSPEALTPGPFAQLQVVAPSTKINSGGIPTFSDNEITVLSGLELGVLDGLVAPAPLYVVTRTSDSAL